MSADADLDAELAANNCDGLRALHWSIRVFAAKFPTTAARACDKVATAPVENAARTKTKN